MTPTALDVFKIPLSGSHLIEASAGTGKTWTLAALYLRLVLGHGEEGLAFSRALAPCEILVLTFTRAATRELAERIRARLLQAADAFRASDELPDVDPFLMQLLNAYPETALRRQAAWRLERAAQSMDEAAIHTIDAWCQRSLREHVFDSHGTLNPELLSDESALLEDAVRDYWRAQLYVLSGPNLDRVLSVWPSLERLQTDVRDFLRFKQYLTPFEGQNISLAELLKKHSQDQAEALAELKTTWRPVAPKIAQWLQQQFDQAEVPFDKKKFNASNAAKWSKALVDWAQTPAQVMPVLSDTAWGRLQPSGLRLVLKAGCDLWVPDFFDGIALLMQALADLPQLKSTLRMHSAVHVAQRMQLLKKQSNACGFDDFQNQLNAALHGPHAARLRANLLTQYPVALIDEFQDTSSVQAQIFNALYRLADNEASSAVFLIGDPKQSIYAFRGADIHSYLQARQATQGRHHMLATNHRASVELVGAVNKLFGQAQARPGSGAFLFRTPTADPLPFIAVAAQGRQERFFAQEAALTALTWCFDDQPRDQAQSLVGLAGRCAQKISALLGSGCAYFETDSKKIALRPADMAVLVRNRNEAFAVQQALQAVGVASVYLSDQNSVFTSPQAADLLRWLQAANQPRDARLLRAALATATMGFSLDELKTVAHSEDAFERYGEHFIALHEVWASQGVLSMLRRALHWLNLPSRWLKQPSGERCLTNVLHLAELLQSASEKLQSPTALIEWLLMQMHAGTAATTEQLQRLESDADLVKVVTVHKSKGLEYGLVFLPFASSKPRRVKNTSLAVSRDENQNRRLELNMTAPVLAQAEIERLQEDLRLLYVALTRARHAVWVGVSLPQSSDNKDDATGHDFHRTALGYLLTGPAPVPGTQVRTALLDLCTTSPGMEFELLTEVLSKGQPNLPEDPNLSTAPLVNTPPYEGRFDTEWRIGSFSALVRHMVAPPLLGWPGEVREDERFGFDENSIQGPVKSLPWYQFPKGPVAGNFLHHQLEWLAKEGFSIDTCEVLQQQLLRRCEREGFGPEGGDVLVWLRRVVSQTIPLIGSSLANLTSHLPEMEFWLPIAGLASQEISAVCAAHWPVHHPRAHLPQRELHGMLMGFADLVFESQGRYWVLDYKSNHLGNHPHDYYPGALEAACAQHRYDVQAALYLLALHRLLKARLGQAYEADKHLGGAIFFFVRGIETEHRGCHHFPAKLALLNALEAILQ